MICDILIENNTLGQHVYTTGICKGALDQKSPMTSAVFKIHQ